MLVQALTLTCFTPWLICLSEPQSPSRLTVTRYLIVTPCAKDCLLLAALVLPKGHEAGQAMT